MRKYINVPPIMGESATLRVLQRKLKARLRARFGSTTNKYEFKSPPPKMEAKVNTIHGQNMG